jgi:outer membrane protein OmpA-like peptidoglycan-associated protein
MAFKILKNKGVIVLLFMVVSFTAFGQLDPYKWRLGAHIGYSNYYGDLSPYRINGWQDVSSVSKLFSYNTNYVERPSFFFSVERRLSPTVGLMLSAGHYSFAMSDRFVKPDGTLKLDAPNFNRGLNFQSRTQDAGFAFVFKTDNDKFLSRNAFIAPYFTLGAGVLRFDTFADLRDDLGIPYNYIDPLSVVNNGDFETNLQALQTEGVNYSNTAFYTNLGIGIRFKLGYQLELNFHSDFRMAFTDYLDDVSGNYLTEFTSAEQQFSSNPTNQPIGQNTMRGSGNLNDWYIFHGVGLRFSFAPRKQKFNATPVHGLQDLGVDKSIENTLDAFLEEQAQSEEKTEFTSQRSVQPLTKKTINNYTIIYPEDSIFKANAAQRIFEQEKRLDSLILALEHKQLSGIKSNYERINNTLNQELNSIDSNREMSDSLKTIMRAPFLDLKNAFTDSIAQISAQKTAVNRKIEQNSNRIFEDTLRYQSIIDTVKYSTSSFMVSGEPTDDSQFLSSAAMRSEKSVEQTLIGLLAQQQKRDSALVELLANHSINTQIYLERDNSSTDEEGKKSERVVQTKDNSKEINNLNREIGKLSKEIETLKKDIERSTKTRERSASSAQDIVVQKETQTAFQTNDFSAEFRELNRQLRKQNQLIAAMMGAQVGSTAILSQSGKEGALANDSLSITLVQMLFNEQNLKLQQQDSIIQSLQKSINDLKQPQDSVATMQKEEKTTILPIDTEQGSLLIDSLANQPVLQTDTLVNQLDSTVERKVMQEISFERPSAAEQTKRQSEQRSVQPIIKNTSPTVTPKANLSAVEFLTNKISVYFELNADQLSESEADKLKPLIEVLKRAPELNVMLTGFADNSGDLAYNLQLCERRTNAVKSTLIEAGINESRISMAIGGKVVRGTDKSFEPSDRRVEIIVVE